MKEHDEDDLYTPGSLYKAVSETVLVELEPAPLLQGMKLLLHPEQIRILKVLQKRLRNMLGTKPDIALVLNGLVAVTDINGVLPALADWLQEHRKDQDPKPDSSCSFPDQEKD